VAITRQIETKMNGIEGETFGSHNLDDEGCYRVGWIWFRR